MECKECGCRIPMSDEWDNEPKEGDFYFTCVSNPASEELVTKREDFYCSLECLKADLFEGDSD